MAPCAGVPAPEEEACAQALVAGHGYPDAREPHAKRTGEQHSPAESGQPGADNADGYREADIPAGLQRAAHDYIHGAAQLKGYLDEHDGLGQGYDLGVLREKAERGSAKIKSSTDTSPEMATEAYIVRRTQRSVDSVSPPPI